MKLHAKLLLIVACSICTTTIPGILLIQRFSYDKALRQESLAMADEVDKRLHQMDQLFSATARKLASLAAVIERELAPPEQPGELEEFERLTEQMEDGVIRNRRSTYNGHFEAGIFLPPFPEMTSRDKVEHLRIKRILDVFGAAATRPHENVYYLSPWKSEIPMDRGKPDYVFEMAADTDYASTPWVQLGHPSTNPDRKLKVTPPLYDPVWNAWMVSAILPVYSGDRWIGTIGDDMKLADVFGNSFSANSRYPGEQHFLRDRDGNYILAGDWQYLLQRDPEAFQKRIAKESELSGLFSRLDGVEIQNLGVATAIDGRPYLAMGAVLKQTDWQYVCLVPLDEILGNMRHLLRAVVWVIILMALVIGLSITATAIFSVSRRTRQLARAMDEFGAGQLQIPDGLVRSKDEIGRAAKSFVRMANDLTQSARKLRAEQTRLSNILHGTNVGTWEWNVQTGECGLNARWADIVGYTLDQLDPVSLDTWKRLVHPDDLQKSNVLFEQHFLNETEFYECEVRMRHKNGQWVWVLDRGRLVSRTEDGKPLMAMGTHTDITERKRTEEALRASERRAISQRSALAELALSPSVAEGDTAGAFQLVAKCVAETLEVFRAGIWTLSEDSATMRCLALYEATEKSYSRGMEVKASDLPHYFAAIMEENRIYAEDAQHDPRTLELTDSYLKPLGITSMLDAGILVEGKLVGVVCSEHAGPVRKWHSDEEAFASTVAAMVAQLLAVSERKKAEVQLRKLSQAVDQSPACVVITSTDGTIEYVNPKFAEITGYTPEEAKGKNANLLKSGDQPASFYKDLWDTLSSGNEWRGEFHNKKKNGELFWEAASISPIFDNGGIITHYVAVKEDITERKRTEEEWEKLQAQLAQAQKMESVGRLAGGVAHDFNNMLGVIQGRTEMVLEDLGPDHPLRSDLEEIANAARRSADLTRQLLAFARKQTVAPKVLDLNASIEGMLKMLGRLIGEDINLAWKPGSNLWSVKLDPAQMDQILVNLCVNARDAIGGVGTLTIETGNATFDSDYCAHHAEAAPGDYVLLAVSDNGCGMSAEVLAHLFEPFFTTKPVGEGTGLGLATVYGAVKQNNGFIYAYSEPGQGTTFKIYLPRQATANAQSTVEPKDPWATRGSGTILLVEDEPSILRMTKAMLERLGYAVVAAATPREAIRLAQEQTDRIDLLLTDVVMPEMNGQDLAQTLLAIRPGLRRLFMSGYTANAIAHHGLLDSGVQFLQKPFTPHALAEKIRHALGKSV